MLKEYQYGNKWFFSNFNRSRKNSTCTWIIPCEFPPLGGSRGVRFFHASTEAETDQTCTQQSSCDFPPLGECPKGKGVRAHASTGIPTALNFKKMKRAKNKTSFLRELRCWRVPSNSITNF